MFEVGARLHLGIMTKTNTRSPLAMTAIAAVLAISATPTLAQEVPASAPAAVEAAPPIVLQPAAPAAATPAPTVVSQPMIQTVPAAPVAVAEAEPSASAAAAPAARTTTARRATATRTATTTAAAPVAASAAAPSAPVAAEPVLAPVPDPVAATDPAVAPVATVKPVNPMPSDALIFGGLLAALGLGGAYALSRRRRRPQDEAVEFERPVVTPIVPVAPSATAPAPFKPLVTAPRTPAIAQQIAGERLTSPIASAPVAERRIERFAMPTGPVPQGDERDALIEQMVDAPADKANPFTTRKARRRRAKIMLASRESELKQQARQPFDWRQHETATSETTPARDPALVTG